MTRDDYEIILDYDRTFGSDCGRRVLLDLEQAFSERTSFVPSDPYATHVKEGERSVILRIHQMLAIAKLPIRDVVEEDEPKEETS